MRALSGAVRRPVPLPAGRYADPRLLRLMARWSDTPALILSRCLDALAANPRWGVAVLGVWAINNMLIYLFTDPGARELQVDWAAARSYSVAALRTLAGAEHDRKSSDSRASFANGHG